MNNLRWLVKRDGTCVLQEDVNREATHGQVWREVPSIPEVKEEVKPKIYYVSSADKIKPAGGGMVIITAWTTPITDGSDLGEIQLVEKIPNSVQVTKESLSRACEEFRASDDSLFISLCKSFGFGES